MKKNILVVDDSALMRKVICDIINSESKFQAKDVCRDGVEAYEKLKTTQYDGVVLDVNMPRMGGLELLEKLQQDKIKANVIMVSTLTTKDAEITMLAMERGAIDFVTKPTNIIEAKGIDFRNRLISVLEAVYQTRSQVRRMQNFSATVSQKPVTPTKLQKGFGNKLVALACSTGGPKALQSVIPYLPKNMNAPMVLVQHMPQGFTKSMADRLNEISPIRVKEAEHGDVLEKGCVYVAPGGKHMRITRNRDGRHVVTLSDEPAIGGLKPCADIMYESLRDCGYDEVTCVVLTGMGADGTKGILSLREKKDLYVISQSAETCVVYGMPKSIAETGVVDSVVPLAEVAQTIIKNVGVQ
ncbi:MAG: chemotaxis-specific protein-glutamate methyltransferase CheB [Lachnospiraceae bacterium]|nr:chemotaxis-specific protein-glutamate methyltransferase CheB [Lachnospiraceae bacterium]